MKKVFIILIIVVMFIVILSVSTVLLLPSLVALPVPQKLITAMDSNKNWNNYAGQNNKIDVTDTYVAQWSSVLFSSRITVWDSEGREKTVNGADTGFQIEGDFLYFTKDENLYRFHLITEESELLYEDVLRFHVQENKIYAQRLEFGKSPIYQKELLTGAESKIVTSCGEFWVHDNVLYYVEDQFAEILHMLDLKEEKHGLIYYPVFDMINRSLYFWQGKALNFVYRELTLFDLKDARQTTVPLFSEHKMGSPNLAIATSEDLFFVSWQTLKYDGSFVSSVDNDEGNGLWYIDPKTYEQRKISDLVFDSLFMTDDYLFGTIGNDLYAVDLETFEVQVAND